MKKRPLKQKIIAYLMMGWLIPIGIFIFFLFFSYREAYIERTEKLITNGIRNAAVLAGNKIDESIWLIQKPTYERDWEKAWNLYREDMSREKEFLSAIQTSLKSKYYMDDAFDLYAFYLKGHRLPKCYSSRIGYSYNDYVRDADPAIHEVIEGESNYVQVRVIDNQIYLIRNLYTVIGYEMYGTLVVRLNTEYLFDGFPVEQPENVALCFDGGQPLFLHEETERKKEQGAIYEFLRTEADLKAENTYLTKRGEGYNGYMYGNRRDNYSISVLYVVEKAQVFETLYELYRLAGFMFLFLLPFIGYAFYFLKKQIEVPVNRLVQISKAISEGKIGTKIEGKPMPNAEFAYLVDSFNKMSGQVKYLFDSVYNEQLMRKDAQIMALQAQINPHFLNNTLEMMNWQARMADDVKVCRMIEALSTVLDHSMNRSNRKVVYLSEELRCVDSYLYIMSMRFGQRMKVERDVDEELLRMEVPQLILQPIIENAILHGVERVKSGTIRLHIYHDSKNTYLEVINTGKDITPEKIESIRRILSGEEETVLQGSGKHTSIGMSNVNKRIQLVYGEEYGLFVDMLEDGQFLSKIVLPYEATGQECTNNVKTV